MTLRRSLQVGEPTADVSKEDLATEEDRQDSVEGEAERSVEQAEDEAGDASAEAEQSAEGAGEQSAEAGDTEEGRNRDLALLILNSLLEAVLRGCSTQVEV